MSPSLFHNKLITAPWSVNVSKLSSACQFSSACRLPVSPCTSKFPLSPTSALKIWSQHDLGGCGVCMPSVLTWNLQLLSHVILSHTGCHLEQSVWKPGPNGGYFEPATSALRGYPSSFKLCHWFPGSLFQTEPEKEYTYLESQKAKLKSLHPKARNDSLEVFAQWLL